MKRLVSGIVLMLLLMAMFSLAFYIKPVKSEWAGTVYIRADGSIYPSDAPITTYDNVTYTLTGNITSNANGIVVERDNIAIDGKGFAIRCINSSLFNIGILLNGKRYITIKNVTIEGFGYGVRVESCDREIMIAQSNITKNGVGIYIKAFPSEVGNLHIYRNNIMANHGGITIVNSLGVDITLCNITNNDHYGIYLELSEYVYIRDNNLIGNNYAIDCYASVSISINHNNFINNRFDALFDSCFRIKLNLPYPYGGNYWSKYKGVDLYSGEYQNEMGSDGIGDTPYVIDENNVDKYPLISPYPLKAFKCIIDGVLHSITVKTESGVTHFMFNQSKAQITFKIEGSSTAWIFCNLTIPKSLMTGPWNYTYQGDVLDINVYESENETHTFISLKYRYTGTFQVVIKASWVVPEYPSTTILTIFMLTTTVLAVLTRSRRLKHRVRYML